MGQTGDAKIGKNAHQVNSYGNEYRNRSWHRNRGGDWGRNKQHREMGCIRRSNWRAHDGCVEPWSTKTLLKVETVVCAWTSRNCPLTPAKPSLMAAVDGLWFGGDG